MAKEMVFDRAPIAFWKFVFLTFPAWHCASDCIERKNDEWIHTDYNGKIFTALCELNWIDLVMSMFIMPWLDFFCYNDNCKEKRQYVFCKTSSMRILQKIYSNLLFVQSNIFCRQCCFCVHYLENIFHLSFAYSS